VGPIREPSFRLCGEERPLQKSVDRSSPGALFPVNYLFPTRSIQTGGGSDPGDLTGSYSEYTFLSDKLIAVPLPQAGPQFRLSRKLDYT